MKPSPQLEQRAWFNALPARQREIVLFAENERTERHIRFCDIYHSAHRYIVSPPTHVPALLPSSVIFDLQRSRLLLGRFFMHAFRSGLSAGREALRMQGLQPPRSYLDNFSEANLMDLALPETRPLATRTVTILCVKEVTDKHVFAKVYGHDHCSLHDCFGCLCGGPLRE